MPAKPNIVPSLAKSACPLCCDSPISSSTTTKLIAPGANARAYGRIKAIERTAHAPSMPAIGSITPDAWPHVNAFNQPVPSRVLAGTAGAQPERHAHALFYTGPLHAPVNNLLGFRGYCDWTVPRPGFCSVSLSAVPATCALRLPLVEDSAWPGGVVEVQV